MVEKYCDGFSLRATTKWLFIAPWRVPERIQQVRCSTEQYQSRACWKKSGGSSRSRFADSEQKPWTLAEDPAKRAQLEAVLWIAADTLRALRCWASGDSRCHGETVACAGQAGPSESSESTNCNWGTLAAGLRSAKAETLFPGIEKQEAVERMEAMESDHRSR